MYLSPFRARKIDQAGGAGSFQTSYALTVAPVEFFQEMEPEVVNAGVINSIRYRLNPTNAATYTLRLHDGIPLGGTVAVYQLSMRMIYESPALQADDQVYLREELNIPFVLERSPTPGYLFKLYYSIEWTAAPGVTPGYIVVSGLGMYL
jgi:hypothetical protein